MFTRPGLRNIPWPPISIPWVILVKPSASSGRGRRSQVVSLQRVTKCQPISLGEATNPPVIHNGVFFIGNFGDHRKFWRSHRKMRFKFWRSHRKMRFKFWRSHRKMVFFSSDKNGKKKHRMILLISK